MRAPAGARMHTTFVSLAACSSSRPASTSSSPFRCDALCTPLFTSGCAPPRRHLKTRGRRPLFSTHTCHRICKACCYTMAVPDFTIPPAFGPHHVPTVCAWLQASTRAGVQSLAATTLEVAEPVPGYTSVLLCIIREPAVADTLRLSAAICARNAVKRRWSEARVRAGASGMAPLADADKEALRSGLMSHLPGERHEKVASQIIASLGRMARISWPSEWPTLLDDMVTGLHAAATAAFDDAALAPAAPPSPGALLALKRLTHLLYAVWNEISSKQLASDKRRAVAGALHLIPKLLPMWHGLYARARAAVGHAIEVHGAHLVSDTTSNVSDVGSPLGSVESQLRLVHMHTKVLARMQRLLPHDSIVAEPMLTWIRALAAACAELQGMRHALLQLIANASAATCVDSATAARPRVLTNVSDAGQVDESHGLALIPFGMACHKLQARVLKTVLVLFEDHALTFASAPDLLAAFCTLFVSWITASAHDAGAAAAAAPPPDALRHAVIFLTRILDKAQLAMPAASALASDVAATGGTGASLASDLASILLGMEEANRYAPTPRTAATALQAAANGARALLAAHASAFNPTSHDDWLLYCVRCCFPLTPHDVSEWSADSVAWVLEAEYQNRDDCGLRGAAEALLLSLVSDETYAASMCAKLWAYMRASCDTAAQAVVSARTGAVRGTATDALVTAEAACLALGLAAADAIARGVLTGEEVHAWLMSSALPTLAVLGLPATIASIAVTMDGIAVPSTFPAEGGLTDGSLALSGLLARRMLWMTNCCRSVILPTTHSVLLLLCTAIMSADTNTNHDVGLTTG
ncbi:hypothetical protein EON66_01800, partial [archaeon]